MTAALPDAALDQLFRSARTYNAFSGEISDDTLRQLYDLVKWGPTSANMSPARFVFVKSKAAKARLEPALSEGNHDKTMSAPVTVIVGFDEDFHRSEEHTSELQSLMRISYAVFCLKKKKKPQNSKT